MSVIMNVCGNSLSALFQTFINIIYIIYVSWVWVCHLMEHWDKRIFRTIQKMFIFSVKRTGRIRIQRFFVRHLPKNLDFSKKIFFFQFFIMNYFSNAVVLLCRTQHSYIMFDGETDFLNFFQVFGRPVVWVVRPKRKDEVRTSVWRFFSASENVRFEISDGRTKMSFFSNCPVRLTPLPAVI